MSGMKYKIRINKRVRYIRVYKVILRAGERTNALTKLFIKIFGGRGRQSAER